MHTTASTNCSMEGVGSVQHLLAQSLSTLAKKIESAVERTREDYNKSELHHFLTYSKDENHGILKLFAATPAYAECMRKFGVESKAELEELWGKHYEEPGVKDAVDTLLKAEDNFTKFVAEIDEKLSPLENKLTVNSVAQIGEDLPKEHPLIEIPSGQQTSLEACWKGAKFTLFVLLRLFG